MKKIYISFLFLVLISCQEATLEQKQTVNEYSQEPFVSTEQAFENIDIFDELLNELNRQEVSDVVTRLRELGIEATAEDVQFLRETSNSAIPVLKELWSEIPHSLLESDEDWNIIAERDSEAAEFLSKYHKALEDQIPNRTTPRCSIFKYLNALASCLTQQIVWCYGNVPHCVINIPNLSHNFEACITQYCINH